MAQQQVPDVAPQFFVAGVTPVLIFAAVVWLDPSVATAFLVAALVTLVAPAAFG